MKAMPLVALLALGVVGCIPAPRVMHYSDFDLVIADQMDVDHFCQRKGGKWDDGSPIRFGEHNAGCWAPDVREIWVTDDCEGAKSLPHELAHKDGHEDPDNEGYDW